MYSNNYAPPPINCFPNDISAAIYEVSEFHKTPLEIAMSSVLGGLSLASQAEIDIQLPIGTNCPVSLSGSLITESGNRKTTIDNIIFKPIHAIENLARNSAIASTIEYEGKMQTWLARAKFAKSEIHNSLLKNDKQEILLEKRLEEHYANQPKMPVIPQFILTDATEAALHKSLNVWPSIGFICNDASKILNGRSGEYLSTLNLAWDGQPLKINRKTTDSYYIDGARITLSLMIQPKSFQRFISNRGALARDNGFFSRMLICFPPSTQGYRENWHIDVPEFTNVHKVQQRIKELMEVALKTVGQPNFQRKVLKCTGDAKMAWLRYSNYVENLQKPGGLYCEIKDAASKSAENVARMAALFHHFEGRTDEVGQENVDRAGNICLWYLNEFKRIFVPPPVIPQKVMDAIALDWWLRNTYSNTGRYLIETKYIQMYGPNELSSTNRLNSAINILTHAGCIRFVKKPNSRLTYVELNLSSHPFQYLQ